MANEIIAKCPYCGKLNCKPHAKYKDRCDECGKRYSRYMNYKFKQKE